MAAKKKKPTKTAGRAAAAKGAARTKAKASRPRAARAARAARAGAGDELDTAERTPNYAKGKWAWVFKRDPGEVRYWLVKT
ncbi:MAG: hypothetical protein U9Q74_07835, partial [Gemmatimonadota bacterium]|nr:hypothetical protein [Gemmatimonadota bacterium]